ncbi:MAG: class I SAM-dependent methyltransferase [Planctomycetes bacterium]|nr:class I SAM-dependent methyltransferase [Planctomycetota bacterium]MBI3844058.1 class I SAM-dependent methyltransferase [Planctomycetota bacterium]
MTRTEPGSNPPDYSPPGVAASRPLSEWQRGELTSERHKNRIRATRYLVPLCRRLFGAHPATILDAGCGNGEEVDALREAGHRAFGVDRGYRSVEWRGRTNPGAFVLADATRLPFRDATFDLVLSIGVIEHVGAVGDGRELRPDFRDERRRYAAELWRVTKPGGFVLMATPNRLCPIDVWHGPFVMGGHFHGPGESFLPSYREIRALFEPLPRFAESTAESIDGFFQFERVRRHAAMRALLGPARAAIWLQDRPGLRWLRRSPLNPFLIVLARKA